MTCHCSHMDLGGAPAFPGQVQGRVAVRRHNDPPAFPAFSSSRSGATQHPTGGHFRRAPNRESNRWSARHRLLNVIAPREGTSSSPLLISSTNRPRCNQDCNAAPSPAKSSITWSPTGNAAAPLSARASTGTADAAGAAPPTSERIPAEGLSRATWERTSSTALASCCGHSCDLRVSLPATT